MSYQDIEYHLQDGTGTVHYDNESAVQYLTYAFALLAWSCPVQVKSSELTRHLPT